MYYLSTRQTYKTARQMNYFETNEENDWKLLNQFNEKTHLFKSLGKCKEKHHADASGYTADGRTVMIELKKRNVVLTKGGKFSGSTFKDDNLFIESHKFCDLWCDTFDNYIPLYINFLENEVVAIYILSKLATKPITQKKVIKSNGYNSFEIGHRLGLNIEDALIYKGNKLVKRHGEKWMTQQNS